MSCSLIIGVDIDETIADLLGPWLARYNKVWQDSLLPEDLLEWDLTKSVKPECGKQIYELLDASIYDNNEILPIPGARSAMRTLRGLGHRVVYITSCTKGTIDAKLRWLCRWGFLDGTKRFQPDFIPASDKSLIRADVLLDDKVENVNEFPGMAWLISQPQNAFVATRRPRLRSVAQAPAAIEQWLQDYPYRT